MSSSPPAGQGGSPGAPGHMQAPPSGPPYLIPAAQLGGVPTITLDIPILAILLAIFVAAAALNMTIFQINRRQGHKFVLSAVLFGFCMARINAAALRIAQANHPHNVRLTIAASIFFNAGVLIFFIVNLIFLQRLVRAHHPHVGWSKGLGWGFRFLYFSVFACLAMVITAVVYGFYTLDQDTQVKLRDIRRTASVYMAILAFIPVPGTILCVLAPRRGPVEDFGTGSMRTKVILLLFTASLLSLGAGFRAAVGFMPRPPSNPGWFNHKASYYCFNYVVEIIVVYTYALSRFDRRFWVPNGSSKPGDYSRRPDSKPKVSEVLELGEDQIPTSEEERRKELTWEQDLRAEL
ncbi:hypothetical protein ACRE_013200 [Hapsidospora chrysogenum ATCC 11550]|uniref:Uncharacterized protein n=1 Tax=Hapsidospora chrysogenum (strain ATCC 11550 / CBS 779.69 / DSM 880 / IAM 14645 / JCM 23072 / IMI 49137) TaxID=857340 RepID=A0A086TEI0_HAPC1|nr:hypothetical protein ACRE_013200 [Hapsidospora chrysogenum ATCC 11550]